MKFSVQDNTYYMRLALDLAKSAIGYTSPNPCVGAVVVKDKQIIGMGSHQKAGYAHAEVIAINAAADKAKGATLFVTLEPCNHFGKTPPCTDAIIKSGITKVIIATLDPNPLVSGKGISKLKDAGIDVEVGLLSEEAIRLNQKFFHYITKKTPFITLKCGMSLDAKLATRDMESKWITSQQSRLDAHSYRHTHDAILVGINTILTDDPELTYRGEPKSLGDKNPIRIILDTDLRTPLNAKVINNIKAQTWIIVGNHVSKEQIAKYNKVKIIQMPDKQINLLKLMDILGELQITSILVEGGHKVLTSFIELGLFNQLIIYTAPLLIGGQSSPSLFMGEGFSKLSQAIKLSYENIEMIDTDLKIILNRAKGGNSDVYGNY